MSVDALRLIDLWVGRFLCWGCTCLRRISSLWSRQVFTDDPKKILVIKLSEMGSTVLAYPALQELKRRFPHAQIYFLVFEENHAILGALGVSSENIISIRTTHVTGLLRDGLRALVRLRKMGIDATIDMDFFSRLSVVAAFLICRGRRVGFHAFTTQGLGRGDLLTHRVAYSAHIHTSLSFLALARSLSDSSEMVPYYKASLVIDPNDIPVYKPSTESINAIQKTLASCGSPTGNKPRELIVINPNSSNIFPLRKWPLEFFIELCGLLLKERPEATLLITGSSSETAEAETMVSRVGVSRCVSVAGKTTFPELLALYSMATLLVTNDSGPAHFASMLKLPTIALFGPETPQLYKPFGDTCKALYSEFACSPCVTVYNAKKSPCTDNKCLQAILPKTVLTTALDMLSSKQTV